MKLASAAVLIALLLTAMTVAVLLFIDPSGTCHTAGSDAASIWPVLAFWTAPILAIHCIAVARWDWILKKMAERDSALLVPNEYILIRMCLIGAAPSQLPLFLVVDCLFV